MSNAYVENVMWGAPVLLGLALWLALAAPKKCWRCLGWVLVGAGVWVVIWTSIRYVVADNKNAATVTWVARSVLRGLYALSGVVFSAWFIPALLLVLIFQTELRQLIRRFAKHAKRLEAGGVKIELVELDAPPITVSAQWWADNPAAGDHAKDTAAGDGTMSVRPEWPTKQYKQAVQRIEEILSRVTTANQFTEGPRAKALEAEWVGEYTEYLELTVNVLRQRVRAGHLAKVDDKYLATSFTLRHIMLYIYGDNDHAGQFMFDLRKLNEDHARGTLVRAMGYWFLLFLCERRHFDIARQLAADPLLDSEPATRAAYQALINLKTARYDEAIRTAMAGLKAVPETVSPSQEHERTAAKAVLAYVLAQAYLRFDKPKCAIKYAQLVINNDATKPYGLLNFLKGNARRTLAYACTQTRQISLLQRMIDNDLHAAEDPYVLHALSVALAGDGSRTLALEAAKRASVLLPGEGEAAVRKAVEAHMAQLQST